MYCFAQGYTLAFSGGVSRLSFLTRLRRYAHHTQFSVPGPFVRFAVLGGLSYDAVLHKIPPFPFLHAITVTPILHTYWVWEDVLGSLTVM